VTACQQRGDPFHNHDAGTVAFQSMMADLFACARIVLR
jgi:hypothetical protein